MPAAIEAIALTKTYAGGVQALNGLSFAVEQGTVFGLLGPNGAGKSTAVRILTTLGSTYAGTARVCGRDVRSEPRAVRRAIGVVSQRSGLDDQGSGRENLRLQAQVFGLRGRRLSERVDSLLEGFGLASVADRPVATLSGGMRRRLDVLLALVHEPGVLFLDEPTTGLDPDVRGKLWQEVARLNREGMTVLLTTHYLEEADRLASRLAIVDAGRTVVEGTPEELKRELRDDSIRIELGEDEPDHERVRSTLASLGQVRIAGRTIQAKVPDGPRSLPAFLATIEAAGLSVDSVTVARPSLDDVYAHHTGRTLSAGGTAA